jgi:hypothetical protein
MNLLEPGRPREHVSPETSDADLSSRHRGGDHPPSSAAPPTVLGSEPAVFAVISVLRNGLNIAFRVLLITLGICLRGCAIQEMRRKRQLTDYHIDDFISAWHDRGAEATDTSGGGGRVR